MVVRRIVGVIGGLAIVASILLAVILIVLGTATPGGTHPFYYIALALLGGGVASLLSSGLGAVVARSHEPTIWVLDRQYFIGVRRIVLVSWILAIVFDVLGCLIALAVTRVRVGPTPLNAVTVTVTFLAAVLTVAFAGVNSFVTRRHIPRM